MVDELLRTLTVSALASAVAVVIALAVRQPMRRRFGARAAYALWLIVPFAAAVSLLPVPTLRLPAPVAVAAGAPIAAPGAAAVASSQRGFDARPLFALVWLAGVALAALAFGVQQRRYLRALGPLSPLGGGLHRARANAGCPALVGAWRPRIVVPADFDQRFSAAEQRLIVAHERLHRARGDAQVNLFAAALRSLFWFDPLVHFAASRFRFDQELACDALVIARFPEARRPYADAMLKAQLAAGSWQEPGLPVGCAWQSSHPLKERISMLKEPLPGRARSVLGFAVALVLATAGGYAAWAAQPPAPAKSDPATSESKPATAAAAAMHHGATYRSLSRIAYPVAAIAAKSEAVVYVRLHVGTDGVPVKVSAGRVEPHAAPELAAAAVEGVKQWRFNPAQVAGKPAASDEIVPIVFSLRPDAIMTVNGGTLDTIRVAPPEEPAAASADHPPTEDVSYRQMHPPVYPPDAVRRHVTGKLTFKVHVDEHGMPQSAEVEASDPPEAEQALAQASVEAIMQWRFNPGIKDGKPQDGYMLVPITFALDDLDTPGAAPKHD